MTVSVSEDLVALKHVEIDGAEIAAVVRGKAMNLQQMMDNVTTPVGVQKFASDTDSDVRLILYRLDFTNAKTTVRSDIFGDLSVQIPDIHLKDVGRASNGATIGEVIRQLLDPVYKSVSREMIAQGLDLDIEGFKGSVKDKVSKKLGGGLKSLTNRLAGPD